ncbi:EAL domain, c-di-GMP-specific phosphodiesterase class I (or its enzymatically inactive variant) [Butyrivibrio proteoclasticus]|uniref:EAL domain, c-di-GMP-specific phosphodiesterase class I (Or its enzymatically inactive variant) n=1 Tax=Butyrivibrio proteoclasticus TaxID=43305 RepID=A0A1I5RJ91_9FIRM|nr:EAL domain-containing protein [Butyrivibrio proteoclasticus]SFP58583.1 EAL domain, c-di-GMP-specific phosphodiesterase class I (or its enzymatically inactive variant) [Butyrivibrio proteoclasticus]
MMNLLTNPQNYEICFALCSMVVLFITVFVHVFGEHYYSRQNDIFGGLLFNAFCMSLLGLIHKVWIQSDFAKMSLGYQTVCVLVMLEKLCIYTMPFLSVLYGLAIFRIEIQGFVKKTVFVLPTLCSFLFIFSSIFTDFFYRFDENADTRYIYPQGVIIYLSVWVYLIFAAYLIIKYKKSFSSEKQVALVVYYLLMAAGIPIRILTRSSSIFEFSVSIALLLCVYTFQNPSEFVDLTSGAGTKKALEFTISTNLLQKKTFSLLGVYVDKLDVFLSEESVETSSELLRQISDYLKKLCPDGSLFYPFDSTFILLIPDADPDDAVIKKTAEQIKIRFKDQWILKNNEVKLFQSPCALGFPSEADSLERFNEIWSVMQKALLRHNRDVLRLSELNLKYVEHDKKIDGIVKRALEDGLLDVYYQPIFSPSDGKFTSCEALVRLKDPKLGFISPAVFMPVAERNGSVLEIDRYVLENVCEMISSTGITDYGIEYVEVNLSIVDCIQTNLAENILGTLKKYNVDSKHINLEITETWEKDITDVMDMNLGKLLKAGITFSMDDFGTGYSNLSRMALLPLKLFKLDKSIVQSALDSETSYMVMLNMIKIIKSLGKEIVAEGVETAEQAKQIIRLGCDHVQGFFYARPMPRESFIQFIKEHNS